jgi:NitT/TauT family transport system permease protein
MDTAGSFAIVIVLSLIGIVLHQVVNILRRYIVFWMEPEETLEGESA